MHNTPLTSQLTEAACEEGTGVEGRAVRRILSYPGCLLFPRAHSPFPLKSLVTTIFFKKVGRGLKVHTCAGCLCHP